MTRVLMNDFSRQWRDAGADAIRAIEQVGESGWYILGKAVSEFEDELARWLRSSAVVGCGSGLDAIEIALRSMGLTPGDKVITTPLSAFATSLAIIRAGGIPVFVDVDRFGLLDLSLVEAELEQDASIRFVVPVHLYGHALDVQRLRWFADRVGTHIVEDCAQAIGAAHNGSPVGSASGAAALSFYPTKNLGALGDGGAVIVNDASLIESCRSLRDYGQVEKYAHSLLGLNSRLDELHAAVLLRSFLPRLDEWTRKRRAVAQRYLSGINSSHVQPFGAPPGSQSVWHLFPVRVPAGARDSLIAHLHELGIESGVHYPRLICDQQAIRTATHWVRGDMPRARGIVQTEVSLPIHPYLEDSEVERVIDAVNSWKCCP